MNLAWYRAFLSDVMAAMLVYQAKRILNVFTITAVNFFVALIPRDLVQKLYRVCQFKPTNLCYLCKKDC